MKVEAQITIDKNKKAVWTAITNISNLADILCGVEKIEILSQPESALVGLKWSETRMYFGKPSAIDKWIIDAEENKYYQTCAEMDGFIFLNTMTISELGGNVILTSVHETIAKGFIAKMKSLPMIFFKGMLKKAILQDLEDFKTAVELH